MADLEHAEFFKRLGVNPTQATVQASPEETGFSPDASVLGDASATPNPTDGLQLLPSAQSELDRISASTETDRLAKPVAVTPSIQGASGPEKEQKLMQEMGARPGIPFDMKTGVPLRVRVAAEKEPSAQERLASYQIAYGDDNVRVNKHGGIIVTTTDEKGKTVDKLVNPIGIDSSDMAIFIASAPELAGSILPLIATRGATLGPGVMKALATLALSTGGAELAGGAKDMYQRWLRGESPDMKDIAERRSISGSFGLMTGAGMGAGGFLLGRVISPFNTPGIRQLDARGAVTYLNNKYGTKLKLTSGEQTGAPLLLAGEGLESQKPGSRSAFAKFREKNQAQLDRLKNIATGSLPDDEQAGKRIVTAMKEKLTPLEFDVEFAAQEAARQAEKAIKTTIGTAADKTKIGQSIDIGAKARKSGFDLVNDANYNAFQSHPKSTAKIIGGDKLKAAVDDMLEALPSVEQTVNVPTGLVDAANQPIFTQGTRKIPVTTPVRERLEEISSKLEGGKLSINDLKQIRTDVDNAIKTGEAIPGVKEGRLKRYYSELTSAIEQGLKDINDPSLTKAWKTSVDYYKANVGKFETAGIAELFRDPINAIGPTELVERARSNPDIYAAYKEFFGAASPQLRGVQKAARDAVLDLGNLGKSVDAGAFARRLEELDRTSPQLLKDAFGKKAEMLRKEALVMMRAQGKQIDKAELDQALAAGTLSSDSLRDMITAETRRAEAYNNTLVKQLSQGTLKPDKIKPTQVVDRFVFNKDTQPEHLEELVRIASGKPEALEDLRRLTFKKMLDDVTAVESRTGNRVLSGVSLDDALADQNLSKKLQTVLGEESYGDLEAIRDYLMAGVASQSTFKTAGGLVGGSQLNALLGHGELKAIPQFVKNFVLSTAYTSEPIRRLLANDVLRQEGKALVVNTMIALAPWGRALLETFTEPTAEEVQATIKGYTDQLAMRDPLSARQGAEVTKGTEDIPWDEFLKRLNP